MSPITPGLFAILAAHLKDVSPETTPGESATNDNDDASADVVFYEHHEIAERFQKIYAGWFQELCEKEDVGQFIVIDVHTARGWVYPDLDQAIDVACSMSEYGQFYWQQIEAPKGAPAAIKPTLH